MRANCTGLRPPSRAAGPTPGQERMEIAEALARKTEELSKGMQQKIQSIAALLHDPWLIVVVVNNLGLDADTAQQQAMNIAQTLRLSVAGPYALALQPEHRADTLLVEHRCTASIGVTLFQDGKVGQDEILKRADLAMYRAKDAGRNTICFSDNTTGLT